MNDLGGNPVVTALGVPLILFHDVHVCENSRQFDIYRSVSHIERYSLNLGNFWIPADVGGSVVTFVGIPDS